MSHSLGVAGDSQGLLPPPLELTLRPPPRVCEEEGRFRSGNLSRNRGVLLNVSATFDPPRTSLWCQDRHEKGSLGTGLH
jgi:hypothetical protein